MPRRSRSDVTGFAGQFAAGSEAVAEGGAADAMYFVQPPPEGAAGAGAAAQGVLEAWKGGALVKRYAAHEHFDDAVKLPHQARLEHAPRRPGVQLRALTDLVDVPAWFRG